MKMGFVCGAKSTCEYFNGAESITKVGQYSMVKDFRRQVRAIVADPDYATHGSDMLNALNDLNYYITTQIGFRKHIMFMDVDEFAYKDVASYELSCRNIPHTVIQSSASCRYWIIADIIKRSSAKLVSDLSGYGGVDPKYVKYSASKGLMLRAFPKNGYIPTVVERHGNGGVLYVKYMELWKRYWASPHIKWIVQQYCVNSL